MTAITVVYDPRRGRVRINATGIAGTAHSARVFYAPPNRFTLSRIRGGAVAVIGGQFESRVDHYEFVAGEVGFYAVQTYTGPVDNIGAIVDTTYADVAAPVEEVWIKSIGSPFLNRRVTLNSWSEIARKARSDAYDVQGRPDPVVVLDVSSSRTTTLTLRTRSLQERDALDATLSAGVPCYLQTPSHVALPSMYVTIGDYSIARTPRHDSHTAVWTVPVTEVAAPPLSVVGVADTWQLAKETYPSWGDLRATTGTWLELAGG
jgi:hypothetical protein